MREMIPDLPFRPRAQIEAEQEAAFAEMMDLVFSRHPYYRRIFAERGLTRADIGGLADIGKIPVIAKADYAAEPDAFRLETDGLEDEATIGWDVMHTTGTSGGRPTPFYSTAHDFYAILTANRRALELRGVTKTDVIANLCPMTLYPYGAYHRTIAAANAMKVPVISPLPGRPSPRFHWSAGLDDVVGAVARARATILWGVTSYVRRVLMRAEELGADLSAARVAFVTGEPVSAEMRKDLTRRMEALGVVAPSVNVSYAATEMQVGAVECVPDSGFHNPAPDQFFFEVVDPKTHRPLPDGTPGLAVMTHLDRRGTVLLRYALGDLVAMTRAPCPHCGATTDRFTGAPARADDLVKVRGMLVDPAAVADLALATPEVREYQLVIDRENPDDSLSMDRMTLRLCLSPEANDKDISQALADAVRRRTGVRPVVEIAAIGKIFDPDRAVKARRFLDTRKGELPA